MELPGVMPAIALWKAGKRCELPLREKAMVMVAGSTGLRRSELIALTWRDIDPLLIEVNVLRSRVRNHFGDTKTEASRTPVAFVRRRMSQ